MFFIFRWACLAAIVVAPTIILLSLGMDAGFGIALAYFFAIGAVYFISRVLISSFGWGRYACVIGWHRDRSFLLRYDHGFPYSKYTYLGVRGQKIKECRDCERCNPFIGESILKEHKTSSTFQDAQKNPLLPRLVKAGVNQTSRLKTVGGVISISFGLALFRDLHGREQHNFGYFLAFCTLFGGTAFLVKSSVKTTILTWREGGNEVQRARLIAGIILISLGLSIFPHRYYETFVECFAAWCAIFAGIALLLKPAVRGLFDTVALVKSNSADH